MRIKFKPLYDDDHPCQALRAALRISLITFPSMKHAPVKSAFDKRKGTLFFAVVDFVRASCANSTTLHSSVCIFPRNIGASRYWMNCGAGLFVVVSQASVLWPRVPNLFHTGPPRRFVWLGWPSEGQ